MNSLKAEHERLGILLCQALSSGDFRAIICSKPRDSSCAKQVRGRIVELKDGPVLNLESTFVNSVKVDNIKFEDVGEYFCTVLVPQFGAIRLCQSSLDWVLDTSRKGVVRLNRAPATVKSEVSTEHNKRITRIVPIEAPYLHELGITTLEGATRIRGDDKYRQIVKFIEIVASLIDCKQSATFRAFDLGCGKGYLTFALADFIGGQSDSAVLGVDIREDLVRANNALVRKLSIGNLSFRAASAKDIDVADADLVVALHACDVATDEAITVGVAGRVKSLILAPCCHKFLRPKVCIPDELSSVLRYGIHQDRFFTMVTDSLRALALEYSGYETNVFEFISSDHTAKNVMITANRKNSNLARREKAKDKYFALKSKFSIEEFPLDCLF